MDEEQPKAPLWEWQGFFGVAAAVAAEKLIVDDMDPQTIGAVVPARGDPPMPVTGDGTMTMFAFHVPFGQRLPVPEGLFESRLEIVGRLVGA